MSLLIIYCCLIASRDSSKSMSMSQRKYHSDWRLAVLNTFNWAFSTVFKLTLSQGYGMRAKEVKPFYNRNYYCTPTLPRLYMYSFTSDRPSVHCKCGSYLFLFFLYFFLWGGGLMLLMKPLEISYLNKKFYKSDQYLRTLRKNL